MNKLSKMKQSMINKLVLIIRRKKNHHKTCIINKIIDNGKLYSLFKLILLKKDNKARIIMIAVIKTIKIVKYIIPSNKVVKQ